MSKNSKSKHVSTWGKPAEIKVGKIRHSPYNFRVFNVKGVQEKLSADDCAYKLKKPLEKMVEHGGVVRFRKQPMSFMKTLAQLDKQYPHFEHVTAYIRKRMKLNALQQYPALDFGANLLLAGPAGVGKSSYLFKLAECFKTEFYNYNCAATSNPYDLVGLSPTWSSAHAGKLYELLVTKKCPNPIILLDEVEKVSGNLSTASLSGALYGLLEKNNAKYFRDEFIDVELNASKVNWFATCNYLDEIDKPILDRFKVLNVRAATSAELRKMVPHIYLNVLESLGVKEHFSLKLHDDVLNLLCMNSATSIRTVKASIEAAISNAVDDCVKNEKVVIKTEHIDLLNVRESTPKIGFVWQSDHEMRVN